MKYILKKDLPLAKAGTEVEFSSYSNDEWAINMILESVFHKKHIADINKKDIPEWLEEVKEPKTIYDLKTMDIYYWIQNWYVEKYAVLACWLPPRAELNCFPTEREAKRNKLLRELATRTDKWLPEIDITYITHWCKDWFAHTARWEWDKHDFLLYHMWLVFRNEEEYNKYMTDEARDLLFNI